MFGSYLIIVLSLIPAHSQLWITITQCFRSISQEATTLMSDVTLQGEKFVRCWLEDEKSKQIEKRLRLRDMDRRWRFGCVQTWWKISENPHFIIGPYDSLPQSLRPWSSKRRNWRECPKETTTIPSSYQLTTMILSPRWPNQVSQLIMSRTMLAINPLVAVAPKQNTLASNLKGKNAVLWHSAVHPHLRHVLWVAIA